MNEVRALPRSGAGYLVRRGKGAVNHAKAVRDLLRLRVDDEHEKDVRSFLAVHAFALPDYARCISFKDAEGMGLVSPEGRTRMVPRTFDGRSGAPAFAELDDHDALCISKARLAQYQDALSFVAMLALARVGADGYRTTTREGEARALRTGEPIDLICTDGIGARGRMVQESEGDGRSVFGYGMTCRVPPVAFARLSGMSKEAKKYLLDGDICQIETEHFVRPLSEESPVDPCEVDVLYHSNQDFRGRLEAVQRMLLGVLMLALTPRNDNMRSRNVLTVDPETCLPVDADGESMMHALATLADGGRVHSCARCHAPVIGASYCPQSLRRCQKADNEEARARVALMSEEQLSAQYPAIKRSTIHAWYERKES